MGETNHVLGIIPARGGSKGVPRKNIRLLGGKPLIAYTIQSALQSKIGRVIVSTEDQKIARVAEQFGAEVPFLRPSELATDTASSLSVLLHALHYMETAEQYHVETVVFIQPTSPFLQPYYIDKGIEILTETGVDSVVGIVETTEHPYFQYELGRHSRLHELVKTKNKPLRRQDLPTYYILNCAFYISRRKYFQDLKDPAPIFNPDSLAGVIMERQYSVDIDSPLDFIFAEAILESGLISDTKNTTEKKLWNASQPKTERSAQAILHTL